ncbi:hypothetical protein ABW20_dc0108466 [Dactylellina cionopaga]|nr:hypothetical protein ABW20_dc0108466 [Dactylellina cionopaga]
MVGKRSILKTKEPEKSYLCHANPVYVPNFLPFPSELLANVFSFLDWVDIGALQKIKSKYKLEISDIIWKQIISRSESFEFLCLGRCKSTDLDGHRRRHRRAICLSQPELSSTENQHYSWNEVFRVARCKAIDPAWENRRRIWKICKGLASQVRDIAKSKRGTLDLLHPTSDGRVTPRFSGADQQSQFHELYTEPERLRIWDKRVRPCEFPLGAWAQYTAEISESGVTHIAICYAGFGDPMRYVSGIQLLPSGKSIGYITHYQKVISLSDKNVISVAMSKHGLVDISFSADVNWVEWLDDVKLNWPDETKYPQRKFDSCNIFNK